MIVRYGSEADLAALTVVELSAGTLFEGTHMAWAVGQTSGARDFRRSLSQNKLWIADSAGMPVGFLRAERIADSFYIDEMSVAAAYQRQGIGQVLMEAALAEATRRGFTSASLTTDRTLPWNAPYYERFGFRIITSTDTPPALARRLAAQPNATLRCVMWRDLP